MNTPNHPAPRQPAAVDPAITRRDLLQAAAVGVLAGGASEWAAALQSQPAASAPDQPWWMSAESPRSRVADLRSDNVVKGLAVDRILLRAMLQRGMQTLLDEADNQYVWRKVLGEAKTVTVKFNHVGADAIGTTDALASVLVGELQSAGFEPKQITLVEAPPWLAERLGCREPAPGWGETIPVGGQQEPLARYLLDTDALINVPFLKTHQIAGVSASMKNLAYAVIRHPARYHANACTPFVGEIIRHPLVSAKLRLNILNALRVVVDRGPDADARNISAYGGLLIGADPVAVDSVGVGILTVERRRMELTAAVDVPYLRDAGERGVGRWRPADIERLVVAVPGA